MVWNSTYLYSIVLLNEVGKKDESIFKFNLCKGYLRSCQDDYNYEIRYQNAKCDEYYEERYIVRRRKKNYFMRIKTSTDKLFLLPIIKVVTYLHFK